MVTLIFGGSGQLGQELGRRIKNAVMTFNKKQIEGIKINLENPLEIEDTIIKLRPEIVINTAAMTDVDGCERDKERSMKINAESVRHMVRAASVVKSYFIQISTDYVFDGEKGNYFENDLPNPLNYYGLTKLLGEAYALSYDYSLVVRTSGVYSNNKNNFPLLVLTSLKQGKQINAVEDMYYSPIHSSQLAEAIIELISQRRTGIINVASDRISRYELAIKIAEESSLNPSLINKVKFKDMKWLAKRPLGSSLDSSKAKKFIDTNLSLNEGIRRLIRNAI